MSASSGNSSAYGSPGMIDNGNNGAAPYDLAFFAMPSSFATGAGSSTGGGNWPWYAWAGIAAAALSLVYVIARK